MGRVDGQIVGQRQDPRLERPVEGAREGLRLFGGDEVRPGDGAREQRAAREQGGRSVAVEQEISQVLRRVAGRGDGSEPQPPELDVHAVVERGVSVREAAGSRGKDRGPRCRELAAAGDEVGMKVRLEGMADRQATMLRKRSKGPDVPRWIDHECPSVANLHDVGGIPQALVHERGDLDHEWLIVRKLPAPTAQAVV